MIQNKLNIRILFDYIIHTLVLVGQCMDFKGEGVPLQKPHPLNPLSASENSVIRENAEVKSNRRVVHHLPHTNHLLHLSVSSEDLIS